MIKFTDKVTLLKLLKLVLGEKNQPCLAHARYVKVLKVSKNVNVKFQLRVGLVRKENLRAEYVPSKERVLDVLTTKRQVQESKYFVAPLEKSCFQHD